MSERHNKLCHPISRSVDDIAEWHNTTEDHHPHQVIMPSQINFYENRGHNNLLMA